MASRTFRTKFRWTLTGAAATRNWGRSLARILKPGDVIALVGDLGSGKTTLVQGLARGWRVRGDVGSPTFALANEYSSRHGRLVHMDLYRLTPLELKSFPIEEYFEGSVCVIEWADRARQRWPPGTLRIHLSAPNPTQRLLQIESPGLQWKTRLKGLPRA